MIPRSATERAGLGQDRSTKAISANPLPGAVVYFIAALYLFGIEAIRKQLRLEATTLQESRNTIQMKVLNLILLR